jgi:hypothetical protein
MPLNLKHNHSNYPTPENLKFINLGHLLISWFFRKRKECESNQKLLIWICPNTKSRSGPVTKNGSGPLRTVRTRPKSKLRPPFPSLTWADSGLKSCWPSINIQWLCAEIGETKLFTDPHPLTLVHFSPSLAALLSTATHRGALTATKATTRSAGATVSLLAGACVRPRVEHRRRAASWCPKAVTGRVASVTSAVGQLRF